MVKKYLYWIIAVYKYVIGKIELFLSPLLLLSIRLWMAKIFWQAGMTKITDWNSTIMLFKYEYNVPFLPPEWAALFATSFELVCPILLVIGLMSRLATLPMLAMTVVIQFTYLDLTEHYYWGMLLLTILCCGAGRLSLDGMIKKRCNL